MINDEQFRNDIGMVLKKHKPRSILIVYSFATDMPEEGGMNLNEGITVQGDLQILAQTMAMALDKSPELFFIINGILKKMGGTS